MSESVIYDARFLCDVHLSSLRASSHCLNLHPISPWPRPWTQTSPSAKTTLRSKTACGMTAILIDDSVQHCFSMSVANGVFARMTGKPERLRCGEDFIWESLLSQGKSARHHKGSKSQPVRLVFFMFLSSSISEGVLEGSSDQRSSA